MVFMTKIRRSGRAFLACVATLVACLAMMFAGIPTGSIKQAQAAGPETDLFPAPWVKYSEDFENSVGGSPKKLSGSSDSYVSADGHKYTASNYWLNNGYCNGFISNSNMNVSDYDVFYTYCGRNLSVNNSSPSAQFPRGDYQAVQAKDYALGLLRNASNPGQNNALSTNTSGGKPSTSLTDPNSIMFRTDPSTPITTLDPNRFYSFSVDAANSYCANTGHDPQMRFEYVQDGKTYPISNTVDAGDLIDPCTSAGSNKKDLRQVNGSGLAQAPDWAAIVNYGTFYSGSFLTSASPSPIDLILRNISQYSSGGAGIGNPPANGQQGASGYVAGCTDNTCNGNDGAIDNIQILDTTPRLTKTFDPAVTSVGATSQLTLTVNNRSDNAEKTGWSFTDTLPNGLTIAPNPNVGGSCLTSPNAATVVATANGQTITVSNGKLHGAKSTDAPTSCTIQVNVTSTQAAVYTNGSSNISQNVGIDGPAEPATVKFTKGSVRWQKVDSATNQVLAGSQWQITRTDTNNLSSIGSTDLGTVGPRVGTPFTITDTGSGSSSSVGTTDDYTKDADSGAGYLAVQYLPWGNYSLKETQAPAGYAPSSTTYTFTIGAGGLTVDGNTVISDPVTLSGMASVTRRYLTGSWIR